MNRQDPDAQFEAMLKAAAPYVEDRGFTQRVMAALPARRRDRSRSRILVGFGLAAALALMLGPACAAGVELFSGVLSWPAVVALAASVLVFAGTSLSVALREAES